MIAEKPSGIFLSIEDRGIVTNIKDDYPNLVSLPDEYIYEFLVKFDNTKDKINKCRQNIAEQLIHQEEAARLEELKKKEAEEKLKEELKKKADEERLIEEQKKKAAEERLKEEQKKKASEERLREDLKKKAAEERLREEQKKKEAEDNLRMQEKINRIIEEEKANQLKFKIDSNRKLLNPIYNSQNVYEENEVEDIEEYDPYKFSETPSIIRLPTEKKIEEANKKPDAFFQSAHVVNFNEQLKISTEKKIKPSPVVKFETERKKPEISNENYKKYMMNIEDKMLESSDLIKKNPSNDPLKYVIDDQTSPCEYFVQKPALHSSKPEKFKKTEPQKKKADKKSEKLIEEEIKIPLNIKKYTTHNPKYHKDTNYKISTPALNFKPISSNIKQYPKSNIEKQLEESKRKHEEKFKSIKNKLSYKSIQPMIPYELKNTKNPHLFYNSKEPIPSLYYQEDFTYEQLVELDVQNYDEGNGYPPSVIAKLSQISYSKNCEEKETCPICMDVFEKENIVSYLNCGHTFHYNCLANWLSRKKKCPVGCNTDLDDFFNGD